MTASVPLPFQTLRLERRGAVDWLCLDRPKRLNAINPLMRDELSRYFGGLADTPATRVVVLHGAGRAFCAGLDLKERDPAPAAPAASLRAQRRLSEIVLRMRRCPQPIICLLHGAASGGGFALALAADLRLAAPDARMNVAMIKVGLSGCDMGISYRLPRVAGASVAAELMLGGHFIDAQRGLQVGLVSQVLPAEALHAAAEALAADMLRASPLGLRLTKQGLDRALDAGSLEQAVAWEDRAQVLCVDAGYLAEGAAAFREGRAPDFSGGAA